MKKRAVLSYCVVALFLFFEMAVQVSPSVMTDQLRNAMGLTSVGLGLMSGFYFYTYTMMQIPSGMLFDRFQPRYVIVLSILACAVGCWLFSVADTLLFGSVARLMMGLGSAFAFVAVLVVTADLFDPQYFATITGITQTLAALGAMAGQMPLSYAVHHYGWRVTMSGLAGAGVLLAVVVWFMIHYKRELVSSLSASKMQGLMSLVKSKQTLCLAVYACMLWAPMSGFASLWGVPFLRDVYHLSDHDAALMASLMWLGLAVFSPILGWWSTKIQSRVWPLFFSALLGAVAFAVLIYYHCSPALLVLCMLFSGAACAGQALSFTCVKEGVDRQMQGSAIAINNMAVVISGAMTQPLIGHFLRQPLLTAVVYRHSMLIILLAYIIGSVVALCWVKETFVPSVTGDTE